MPYNFNNDDLDFKSNDEKSTELNISSKIENDRWDGIFRDYSAKDVEKLSSSIKIEYTLASKGAKKLWHLLNNEKFIATLGTFTGNMAVQQAKAGLKAIYVSGWQVAADANSAGQTYPDQSLYPVNSVPKVVSSINKAFISYTTAWIPNDIIG